MATIQNSEVTQEISRQANLQTEAVNQLSNVVAPVLDVNPNWYVDTVKHAETVTTGNTTVFTTPSDKDFYLCGIMLSTTNNSTYDGTGETVSGKVFGDTSTVRLASLVHQALVAGDRNMFLTFPRPIKMARGEAILLQTSFTAGACRTRATIFGFNRRLDS